MPAGISVVALLLVAAPAPAQADLPPLDLGPLHGFDNEDAARRGCPGDIVVWADHDTGFFYPKWHKLYGHSPGGTFACYKAARRADYWDINPFSLLDDPKAGREFPIDPSLLDWGS